jgi:hypothetical protein
LPANDDVLEELMALKPFGIRAVLDGGQSVRLGHLHWLSKPNTPGGD